MQIRGLVATGLLLAVALSATGAAAQSVPEGRSHAGATPWLVAFDWHANSKAVPTNPVRQARLVRQARQNGLRGRGWNCSLAGSGSGSDCVLR